MTNTKFALPIASIDDWNTLLNHQEKVKKIEYDFDPLAYYIAANKLHNTVEIHSFLSSTNESDEMWSSYDPKLKEVVISKEDKEYSNKIRSHFKNKILMKRLKDRHITKYTEELETILSQDNFLNSNQVSIVVKLLDFYKEDIETDKIFKKYKSLEDTKDHTAKIKKVFTHVGCVERNAKSSKKTRYYFSCEDRNLLVHEVSCGSHEQKFLEFILKQNATIGISGIFSIGNQHGYEDFILYKDGHYEFYNANS
jgi:hypothetical protein